MDTSRSTQTPKSEHHGIKSEAIMTVLKDREEELLELKGPCSNKKCPLHYAHRGPCA